MVGLRINHLHFLLKEPSRCEPLAVQPAPTSPIHPPSPIDIGTELRINGVLQKRNGIEFTIRFENRAYCLKKCELLTETEKLYVASFYI